MKINIISTNNGVGLFQDYLILKEVLETKHDINFVDFKSIKHSKADVNIHLEHAVIACLQDAPFNIFIPNPEWCEMTWVKYLPRFNQIWCKTLETGRIFSRYHKNCIYTSFTSIDRYNPEITRDKIFFHNRGKSSHKGTLNVINGWREIFGKLYINSAISLPKQKGIIINDKRLSDEDLQIFQNACLFHVCPSEVEGFGHYINEAKSCGAIVITTNAAPMNEFITHEFGRLVEVKSRGKHQLGVTNYINPISLTFALNECLHLSDKSIKFMSEKSRQSFLDNDKFFKETILKLL